MWHGVSCGVLAPVCPAVLQLSLCGSGAQHLCMCVAASSVLNAVGAVRHIAPGGVCVGLCT